MTQKVEEVEVEFDALEGAKSGLSLRQKSIGSIPNILPPSNSTKCLLIFAQLTVESFVAAIFRMAKKIRVDSVVL